MYLFYCLVVGRIITAGYVDIDFIQCKGAVVQRAQRLRHDLFDLLFQLAHCPSIIDLDSKCVGLLAKNSARKVVNHWKVEVEAKFRLSLFHRVQVNREAEE